MIIFEDKVSCVIDTETGKRVSKWFTRFGDAVNVERKMNCRFGGEVPSTKYKAISFDLYGPI